MRKVTGSPTAPVAITPRPRTLGLASVADRESFACRSLSACLSKFPVKNWAETGGTREVQTARAEPTRKLSHTPRRQAERRRDRTRAHILILGTDGANAVPGKKNFAGIARTKRTSRTVLFKIIEVAFTSVACSSHKQEIDSRVPSSCQPKAVVGRPMLLPPSLLLHCGRRCRTPTVASGGGASSVSKTEGVDQHCVV